MNLDRNECNILVTRQLKEINDAESSLNLSAQSKLTKNQYERKLVPIDHGLSIPDTLQVSSWDLVWLSYSQADMPFSQRSLDYIRNIDVMADIEVLEKTFKFRPKCLRNMRISSTLLKKGAEAGLTLQQIGEILCRPDDDDEQPSILEQIVKRARTCANMKATMQTKIKDSTLRMFLPQKSSCRTPRQNSRVPRIIKISDVDESDEKQDSPRIKPFLIDNSKLKAEGESCSPGRKRGYSDVDQINFNSLKLNIKASLQKVCDHKLTSSKSKKKKCRKVRQ